MESEAREAQLAIRQWRPWVQVLARRRRAQSLEFVQPRKLMGEELRKQPRIPGGDAP